MAEKTGKIHCPKCDCVLSLGERLVLAGECRGHRVLFLFHASPGNHDYMVDDDVEVARGTVWEFRCPTCFESLTASFDNRLAEVRLLDGERRSTILFSRIAGQRATFVIGAGGVVCHGDDHDLYAAEEMVRHFG